MRGCPLTFMAVTLLALPIPVQAQDAKALRAFHAGLESYPLQLHELKLAEYLEIKRKVPSW
jgi:hypothetical protein